MSMFEEAARLKVRFGTTKGWLTVEDLYDLPLTSKSGDFSLDAIAKSLHREIRNNDETVSFVDEDAKSDVNKVLSLKFDVVKHIIEVKKAERDRLHDLAKRNQEKHRIMEIIADKKDEDLKGKSLDELNALLANL